MAEKESAENMINVYNDPMYLAPNESTQMQLSPTLFDGNNFLTLSRSVKLSLRAKNKMGFVVGTLKQPNRNSKEYPKWLRNDHMVRCWLFRSMKEEIANDFCLVESAQQFWEQLHEMYSHSRAPLLYQLKRDLGKIEQGEMSVAEYYGKLRKYWDEIFELKGLPRCEYGIISSCSCGIMKKLVEKEERSKIIEFLMKLNKNFDDIRGQIVAMDPLPS
ncbi:Retrovirus-related Pol polyprotein from transposon RE1 [Bienertia sinuspersici]